MNLHEKLINYDKKGIWYSIGIINKWKLENKICSGYADIDNNILVSEISNFRLASVTKQFIAISILILIQNGKLKLNDSIRCFFTDFPILYNNITIYHLLTHTSGIYDYEDLITDNMSVQLSDEDVVNMIRDKADLLFLPWSVFRYNNGGYCLLRFIIEKVTSQSIDIFLKENIFIPLGMNDTCINYEWKTIIPNRAYWYSFDDHGKIILTDQDITSATIGDGGIYSSLHDLQKFDKIYYTNIILSKDMRNLMIQKHILTDEGKEVYYWLGLYIREYKNNIIVYHWWSSIWFHTGIWYLMNSKFTVVFLSNITWIDWWWLVNEIIESFIDEQESTSLF